MDDFLDSNSPVPSPLRAKYAPPTLTHYGRLAALTNSASGCANNDSSSCTAGNNMGPVPMM